MTRLAHVCIETADLEVTADFYRLLGLERRFDFRNRNGRLVGYYLAFENRSYVEVILVGEARAEGAVRHFAVECDDLERCRAGFVSRGVEVSDIFTGGDCTRMFTCHDPNGIFIEVMQYTDDSMQLVGGTCEVDYEP